MKRREIEKRLRKLGGSLHRRGSNHDIWEVNGQLIPVPRHNEVKEFTGQGIIADADAAAKRGEQ